jgi:pimeloyl-ACP methyl ester carboxylesterase
MSTTSRAVVVANSAPEWERPTSAVLDTFIATHRRPEKIVLVSLSMGGYLASRAAAFESRIDGLVSYGVMFDLHDALARAAGPIIAMIRRVGRDPIADRLARRASVFDHGARWGMRNAEWTLGSAGVTGMLDSARPYTLEGLEGVAQRIEQDVLILAGTDDQFVSSDQIERYQRALHNARSVTTMIYDRASGGHEHSQLGATTLWQADFFDWMGEKFG